MQTLVGYLQMLLLETTLLLQKTEIEMTYEVQSNFIMCGYCTVKPACPLSSPNVLKPCCIVFCGLSGVEEFQHISMKLSCAIVIIADFEGASYPFALLVWSINILNLTHGLVVQVFTTHGLRRLGYGRTNMNQLPFKNILSSKGELNIAVKRRWFWMHACLAANNRYSIAQFISSIKRIYIYK